ncbi:carbohydrate ABC transporter permease [Gracilibacillus alcaliphilus]|uniref:carbohydrate ABC transporter permease n=1 Tax=Gracilibacillus alcaliphilus TaxID=1401441 RepID=UPI0019565DDB|nr:sugar ABC transporter permease [Gracilibacillus alcaliphilus]
MVRNISLLVVLPSIIFVSVFVYVFIGWTGLVSFSNWNSIAPDLSFNGLQNYIQLFQSFRFQSDIRNMIFFSLLFILGVTLMGQFLAILLEQNIRGKWLFRNIFMFPMAMSFVVTGVAWRWIFNPESGVNIFLQKFGVSPGWYTDTTILPGWSLFKIEFGLPIGLIAVLIAAIWQMTGFSLAMYMAGLSGIPQEVREAALMDGASKWKTYTKVILPQLKPITYGIVLMMLQISLKIFDLVYTMTGSGPNFVTDMPAIYMYEATFKSNFYAEGAAISIVMLFMVMVFVIPYMFRRKEDA